MPYGAFVARSGRNGGVLSPVKGAVADFEKCDTITP